MKINAKNTENIKTLPDNQKATGISKKQEKAAIAKKISAPKRKIPKGMEKVKCPKCFGRPVLDRNCPQDGCNGSGWIIRLKKTAPKKAIPAPKTKKKARQEFETGTQFTDKEKAAMKKPKVKKVVAKVTKPVTKATKVVATAKKTFKKVIAKEKKHGKKNRSKNR